MFGHPVLWLLLTLIDVVTFVIIVGVVLSWLVAFDVINMRNRFVRMIYDTTNAILGPLLRPVRRILPNIGGLDLSPLVLFIGLEFLKQVLYWVWGNLNIPF